MLTCPQVGRLIKASPRATFSHRQTLQDQRLRPVDQSLMRLHRQQRPGSPRPSFRSLTLVTGIVWAGITVARLLRLPPGRAQVTDSARAPERANQTNLEASPAGAAPEGSAAPAHPAQPSLNTFLEPVKFITWLGASVGGLVVVLAVIGFLALAAHDVMLGIPRRLLPQPEYITVGALFFSRTVTYMLAVLLSPFASPGTAIIAAVVLLVAAPAVYYVSTRGPFISHRRWLLTAGPVLLIAGEIYVLQRLTAPLQITHALLQITDLSSLAAGSSGDASVPYLRALLNGQGKQLQFAYGVLSLLTLALALAYRWLELTARASGSWGGGSASVLLVWRWARIPSFTLLLICLFFLVRAYGVLTLSNEYPTFAAETAAGQPEEQKSGPRFLLREEDDDLLLYEPCTQSILSVKRDSLGRLKITAPYDVFLYQRDRAAEGCKGVQGAP